MNKSLLILLIALCGTNIYGYYDIICHNKEHTFYYMYLKNPMIKNKLQTHQVMVGKHVLKEPRNGSR